MRRSIGLALVVACSSGLTIGSAVADEEIALPRGALADEAGLGRAVPALARQLLARRRGDGERDLDERLRLELAAGQPKAALATLAALRERRRPGDPVGAGAVLMPLELYVRARAQASSERPFAAAFQAAFRAAFARFDDKAAYSVIAYMTYLPREQQRAHGDLEAALARSRGHTSLAVTDAAALVRAYEAARMQAALLPLVPALVAEDDARRYAVDDHVLIHTPEQATLSAMVFRPRAFTAPEPAALFYNIYTDLSRAAAREAAAHGYVGVAVETRGKRDSPDEITPYEHEVADTWAAIDWISKQPWCNGKVGMWGNSYVGFAQWAATKRLHPALKVIAPSAAAVPGLGLPMENNVFLNANYAWAFYVTDNKLLDDQVYFDPTRWSALPERWYASGRPYREIDRVDGTPNRLLQRWLQHPAYDRYWQDMVPYQSDFARIDIPVLTITGYYDDAQISALYYLQEHYKYNPRAQHYLLVGPYQHFSAQAQRKPPVVNGYAIDPVAQIDSKEVIFGWLDHVLRGRPRPPILADKVNYEVMGANQWRHAPSLGAMAGETLTLYLGAKPAGSYYPLTPAPQTGYVTQRVDLADRKSGNDYYYPSSIFSERLDLPSGVAYVSEPFAQPVSIDGIITGELKVVINKRDFDVSLVFYELMPDGKLFHLGYYVGRASYARDMAVRHLLTPGAVESVPFTRNGMTSRLFARGSRLVVVADVNKNSYAQVNHGTGKDVSDESIADAGAPLEVQWRGDSYVKVPITRAQK